MALLIGLVCSVGLFVTAVGVLGMEGMLLEPQSQALYRRENDLPPPSTRTGRIVAISVGCSLVLSTGGLLVWMATH